MAKSKAKNKGRKGARAQPAPKHASSSQELADHSSQDGDAFMSSVESSPSKSTSGSQGSGRPAGNTKPALMQHRRLGIPQRPPEQMLESARNRFDEVIAAISRGEEDYDFHDSEEEEIAKKPKPTKGGKRSSSCSPLKSKQDKADTGDSQASQKVNPNAFVLKLFERSVDLAQFGSFGSSGDDVPLYPVCRAWIKNDPNAVFRSDNCIQVLQEDAISDDGLLPGGSNFIGDRPSGIYRLPDPDKRPSDKDGNETDLRIPSAMKPPIERSMISIDEALNCDQAKAKKQLTESNIAHWKSIRAGWRHAAAHNEARYKHSLNVLQSMYDRTIDEPDFDSMVKQSDFMS